MVLFWGGESSQLNMVGVVYPQKLRWIKKNDLDYHK